MRYMMLRGCMKMTLPRLLQVQVAFLDTDDSDSDEDGYDIVAYVQNIRDQRNIWLADDDGVPRAPQTGGQGRV
jgi:hypothetical protein